MILIKQGDITLEKVDAIVNAANTQLKGGGGVDGAIHRAAGPGVMEECRTIGHCSTGEAVLTNAGNLYAKKIIHTAGPRWHGGRQNEAEELKSSYKNSFLLAKKEGLKSIAFPAISTGIYGFPIREASQIALRTGKEFEADFAEIRYICFSDSDFEIYQKTWKTM